MRRALPVMIAVALAGCGETTPCSVRFPAEAAGVRTWDARQVEEALDRFGDRDYEVREEAQRSLLTWSEEAPERILALLPKGHPDPEICERVRILRTEILHAQRCRGGEAGLRARLGESPDLASAIHDFIQTPGTESLDRLRVLAGEEKFALCEGSILLYLLEADPWMSVTEGMALLSRVDELKLSEAAPLVVRFLGHPTAEVRCLAATTLGHLKASAFTSPITDLLADPNPRVRANALYALRDLAAPATAPAIERCLGDADDDVRHAAVSALLTMEAVASWKAIVPLLQDPSPRVREDAAHALGLLGAREAAPAIVPLLTDLQDREFDLPQVASQALGRLGNRSVIPAIGEWIEGYRGDPRNLGWAVHTLGRLTGQDWRWDRPDVAAALAWWALHREDPEFLSRAK